MGFLTDDFAVKKVSKRRYCLINPLDYKGGEDCWTVPAGFQTDYASVPAAVRWLFPQDDDYTMAAILHDWFCDAGIKEGKISARDADAVFRRVMRELGVPFMRRWAIWTGVRWGALANKTRRPGVHKDLWRMILISLLIAPVVLPPSIFVILGGIIDKLVNGFLSWIGIE